MYIAYHIPGDLSKEHMYGLWDGMGQQ